MAEMIYTRVNPYDFIGQQVDLIKSIKQDGIKYPVLAHSNNRIVNQSNFDYGNQRMLIALSLGLDEVSAVLYSIYHKTGFDGEQINKLDDIIRICGEDIKNESVWDEIRGAWKKLPYPKNQ